MGRHKELAGLVFINTALAVYTMMNHYIGGQMEIFLFFCIAMLPAWRRVGRAVSISRVFVYLIVFVSILILLFSVFILKVPAGIALTFFITGLTLVKIYSLNRLHDYAQLMVLSVMAIIAGGALNVTPEYIIILAIYIVIGGYCVYKMHLINEYLLHQDSQNSSSVVAIINHKPTFSSYLSVLAITCLIAFVIFLMVPRESPGWLMGKAKRRSGVTITGFSQKLVLGEMNILLKDKTPVIRIKVSDVQSHKKVYSGILYLRGEVYEVYQCVNNSWQWFARHPEKYNKQLMASTVPVPIRNATLPPKQHRRWDIFYQKPVSTNLFVIDSPFAITTSQQMSLIYNFYDNVILYSSYPETGFHYTLWTESIRSIDIKPVPVNTKLPRRARRVGWKKAPVMQNIPRNSRFMVGEPYIPVKIEKFKPIVKKILRSEETNENHKLSVDGKARRIALYLKSHFAYSLDNTDVDREREPVMDFLVRRKKGHCEYFASAMVLLARAAGLNARLVAGFKGGVYNSIGGYYIIRNCDAHTWVEIYVPGKGWARYDPTPLARDRYLMASESFLTKPFWDFLDVIKFNWLEKVSALKKTQKFVQKVQNQLLNKNKNGHYQSIKNFFEKIIRYIKTQRYGSVWFQLLHWIVGILIAVLVLLLGRIVWEVVRILSSAIRDIFEQRWQKKFGPLWRCPVDFYRKLLLWLIPRGLARAPEETAMEFANRIITQYPETEQQMRTITDKYLCVRFGNEEISRNEWKELMRMCYELEQKIKQHETSTN